MKTVSYFSIHILSLKKLRGNQVSHTDKEEP